VPVFIEYTPVSLDVDKTSISFLGSFPAQRLVSLRVKNDGLATCVNYWHVVRARARYDVVANGNNSKAAPIIRCMRVLRTQGEEKKKGKAAARNARLR